MDRIHPDRILWDELPESIRRGITSQLGGPPNSIAPVRPDKPNFLGFLEYSGRAFVKVAPIPRDSRDPRKTNYIEACRRELALNQFLPAEVRRPELLGHGIEPDSDGREWIWLATRAVDGHPANLQLSVDNLQRYFNVYQQAHDALSSLRREDIPPGILMSLREFHRAVAGSTMPTWNDIAKSVAAKALLPCWARDNLGLLSELGRRHEQLLNRERKTLNPDLTMPNTILGQSRAEDVAIDWAYLGVGTPWVNLVKFSTDALAAGCEWEDIDTCLECTPLTSDLAAEDIDAVLAAQAALNYSSAFGLKPGTRQLQLSDRHALRLLGDQVVGWLAGRIEHRESQARRRRPIAVTAAVAARSTAAGREPKPAQMRRWPRRTGRS